MKNLKKIVAILLAAAMLAGVFMFTSSASETDVGEDVETAEPVVARMYFGHLTRNHNMEGHTWIYIENLTDGPITVGAYTLPKGEGVSVGTYGESVKNGPGLYYNVEAWRYKNDNVYLPISISLNKDLTQSDLDAVNKTILKSNHWSKLFNCAYTAIKIWNTTPGDHMIYLFFPILTQMQVLASKNDGGGFSMTKYAKWEGKCFFQVRNSDGTITLESADPTY